MDNFRFSENPRSLSYRALVNVDRIFPLEKLGSEFMPPLYEGDLLYMPTTLPGVSPQEAVDTVVKEMAATMGDKVIIR